MAGGEEMKKWSETQGKRSTQYSPPKVSGKARRRVMRQRSEMDGEIAAGQRDDEAMPRSDRRAGAGSS
jgi:hypothetical protein